MRLVFVDESEPDMTLPTIEEDWERALAIVAHPDDMEYGAAAAVARWTSQGKEVSYLLVTRGEAGIRSMPPSETGPLREAEQAASCAVVGVSDLEFLDYEDGTVADTPDLHRDLALAIRAKRPEVVTSINHRDDWGPGSWNHADHRVVGRAILDAVREASNPWLHTDPDTEHEGIDDSWNGVRFVAFMGSTSPTHGVDVTETLDIGVESLKCHEAYLANLGGDPETMTDFLGERARESGPLIGVEAAALFELIF